MNKPINIIHLEDDDNDAELILSKIKINFDVSNYFRTYNEKEFTNALNSNNIDIILADYNLPQFDGIYALKIKQKLRPEIPFIFISGTLGEFTAVETIKLGATDYVLKNNLSRLMPSIKRALHESEEVQRRTKAEYGLNEFISQLTNIFENLDEMIISIDIENNVLLQISPACEKIFGYPPCAFYENINLWKELVHPEDKHIIQETDSLLNLGKIAVNDYRILSKNGMTKWVESKIKPVVDSSGKLIRIYGIVSDITQRIQSQIEISNSLKEKELLLKELNHRVKNNLQIISSLIKLQVAKVKDKDLNGLFIDTQNRVMSMSFIHQCLFQSSMVSNISFSEYLRKLVSHLFIVYGIDRNIVNYKINVDHVDLNLDTAVPCGLLVNEIVSNSLKYAFPYGVRGEIDIHFTNGKDHLFNLNISDNGIGLPQDYNERNLDSLGIQLINTLVKQLDGKLELLTNNGTEYKIAFSELQYRNRI